MTYLRLFAFAIAVLCASRSHAATAVLPLVVDFELDDAGFTPSSETSWKWGPPTAGPGVAHSGTQVWGTNLTSATYSASEDAILTSAPIDLSAAASEAILVRWSQYLVTEAGFDDAFVEVSKDGGGTWEIVLGPRSGAINSTWTQQMVLLDSSYATQSFLIRFRLVSDVVPSQGGFFIDDLRITTAPLTPAVALQDFEAGGGGYVASGTDSSWALGTPLSAPGNAFSGSSAWATNLNGLYNRGENSALTSPVLDMTGSAGKLLIVSWWQFLDVEEGYDFARVEVSNDSGTSWQAAQPAESGAINVAGWTRRQALVDASYATSGFRIRFRLEADETIQFDGWAIDDVAVFATADLFPIASSFTRSTPRDTAIQFTAAQFIAAYQDPDGGVLSSIEVTQLPAVGVLKLAGSPVALNQLIPTTALNGLTYEPAAGMSSLESFIWRAANPFGWSAPATVGLNVLAPTPDVVIANPPANIAVNPRTPATFEVVALSTLPLSYQWRKNQQAIAGANGSTFTIALAAEGDEGAYDVVVTNDADQEISSAASLSVNDPVTFNTPPVATTVNEGDDAVFTVAATGTGRLDYQWLKNGQLIADATFATLIVEDVTEADAGSYSCTVTNVVGTKTSPVANLAVRLAPRITAPPVSVGRLVNRGVTLSVAATGAGNLSYQWLKNGVAIAGATDPQLVLLRLDALNSGDYSVRVSNDFASIESDPATLSVFEWADVVGTYQDVLVLEDAVTLGTTPFSGRVTATLSKGGGLTAVLEYRGGRYPLGGRFGEDLFLDFVIRRGSRPPLSVQLELKPLDKTIEATVTHQDGASEFLSTALLPKNEFDAKKNAAPGASRYTVVFPPIPGAASGPAAPGFALATLAGSGRVVMRLELPNRRRLAVGATMDPFGRVPFYARIAGRNPSLAGELAGRLEIQGADNVRILGGDASWREPSSARGFLPAPFGVSLDVVGSSYAPPSPGQSVIALPPQSNLLDLDVTGPISAAPLSRLVRILNPTKLFVDPETSEKMRFRVNLETGFVSGAYFDAGSNRRRIMKGVALQAQSEIRGFVRSENNAATLMMRPNLP